MENILNWLKNFFSGSGVNLLKSVVVLLFGLFIVKIVSRISKTSLQRTPLERTSITFIISIIKFVLYLVLFYFVISFIFPTVSAGLIAVLSSIALAIGLALKDSLSNFASGIVIIFNKPFKEGDYVTIGSDAGTIKSIGLLNTCLYSVDNKKIVIANSRVVNNTITNFSARPTRRIDLEFSAPYGSDLDIVKNILKTVVDNHNLILKEPEPLIRLYQHGENALIFRCRVWVNNSDYWSVYYDLMENVYNAFDANGIAIPFKQLSVHLNEKEG